MTIPLAIWSTQSLSVVSRNQIALPDAHTPVIRSWQRRSDALQKAIIRRVWATLLPSPSEVISLPRR